MLPTLLGHRSGKVCGGVGKLRFGVLFWGALRESKPHQRLDILRHFMKSSMTLFGSLSGVLFWERCLELRVGYFMGRVALLHWFAFARMRFYCSALILHWLA